MIVEWCPGEENGQPCRGGFCSRALARAGQDTMTLVRPVEEGRRSKDVIQIFTQELAKARLVRPIDNVTVLAPDRGVYEIHTCQDAEGGWHWVALYCGERPLGELLVGQPEWTEARARVQADAELKYLRAREAEKTDTTPVKRVW